MMNNQSTSKRTISVVCSVAVVTLVLFALMAVGGAGSAKSFVVVLAGMTGLIGFAFLWLSLFTKDAFLRWTGLTGLFCMFILAHISTVL